MHDLHELYPYRNAVDLGGNVRTLLWNNAALLYAREYLLLSGENLTVNQMLSKHGEANVNFALLYGAAHADDPSYTVKAFLEEADIENYIEYSDAIYSGLVQLLPDAVEEPDDNFEDADLYPENQLTRDTDFEVDWRSLLLSAMRLGLSYTEFLQSTPRAIVTLVGANEDNEGSGDWL